ncbi:MAG: hypothetical protein KF713_05415 [Turneriella sp.]|nr:hypothetical protein [Turneriella sp.]
MKKTIFLFPLFFLPTLFSADSESIQPGEYIADGGGGTLTVRKEKGKTLFEINTIGANFHTCGLSGEVKNNRARLEAMDKECVVTFTKKGRDVDVAQSGEECRYYCGARAAFEGLYLEPAAGCSEAARAKTRKRFKELYDKKNYADALKDLAPLLKTCARTLGWIETGWIKNDIAITQYKLGDHTGCRQTLSSFASEAAQSDDEVRNNYPPSDAETWLPVVKAARYNLGLCSKAQKKK